MKYAINASEVFLCSGARRLDVFVDCHIKFNNLGGGVELASGSLSDGKTTTCTSQEDCGAFALSQLCDPEGQ
jgi:hypothetical protein